MGKFQRVTAVVVTVAAAATGIAVTGSPAAAVLPYCNNVSGVDDTAAGGTRYPSRFLA
ncbi:hypothetical protein [Catellatospora methionotrophica]|uniref:hypothetical protein n=1 Tax=Catellatospora methionotrophica TaxID=121620 RepID=UPI0033D375C0